MSDTKTRFQYTEKVTGGGLYFVGFIGAAVYFISNSSDFWMGALGLLKAMVWPAFLVYEALASLGA